MLNSLTIRCFFYAVFLNMLLMPVAGARQHQNKTSYAAGSSWSMSMSSGYIYQIDADLVQDGSFAVSSLFMQGGPVYRPDTNRSVSFSIGYGHDEYDFSGYEGDLKDPWQEVHSLQLSTPVRWGAGREWTLVAVPVLRFTAENTSDLDNGATGGGFAGFSYQFSDKLTLGPGIGMFSQLEDAATVFPILFIRWKITDRLSLESGRGAAATQGPELNLKWSMAGKWDFFLGGGYKKERFRLSGDGPVPGGIGENSSFPLYAGANYFFTRKIRASIAGGLKIGGEIRQEDSEGDLIFQKKYDPAPFIGVTLSGRF